MANYRRIWVPGGTYFFTVTLRDRSSDLLVHEIALLRNVVAATKHRHPFRIEAWVVLPDHMHCLWTLPPGDCDFATRWKIIKSNFSKKISRNEPLTHAQQRRGQRGIWQARYWEHLIRDAADYKTHYDYIHINPVKHGLVGKVKEWPYSSFHRAVASGIYPLEWVGNAILDGIEIGETADIRYADIRPTTRSGGEP
jgi:putative transposase